MKKKQGLLVDIGNSNTVLASYEDGVRGPVQQTKTDDLDAFLEQMDLSVYEKIMVSSVVPSQDYLFKKHPDSCFISYRNIPHLKLKLKIKSQVGADRLVNALAAHDLFGGPCLVVDSGTAITFCYVDEKGVYHGGSIFPGMGISSRALQLYTAKIPLIQVEKQVMVLGKTTKEAVQIGLYQGYIHMINGMIATYRQEFKDLKVIGTGQGLVVLKERLDLDEFEPDLILKGLEICYKTL